MNKKLMNENEIEGLLKTIHDTGNVRLELIIASITECGLLVGEVKKLTKKTLLESVKRVQSSESYDKFLEKFSENDYVFDISPQQINLEMKRIQLKYDLDNYDSFNPHYFRRCYAYQYLSKLLKGEEDIIPKNLSNEDRIRKALQKVGAKLNHYTNKDTKDYLGLDDTDLLELL